MTRLLATSIFFAALVGCDDGSTPAATSPTGGAATSPTAAAPAQKPSASTAELASCTPTDLFILDWGGDAAPVQANGGKQTTKGSVYDQLGLCFTLVDGNDPEKQVKAYLAGTTPYLRFTSQMAEDFAGQLCANPDTCPVPIVQASWSVGGDHAVATAGIKTVSDAKGKRIGVQHKGPHGGLLVDWIVNDAKLKLSDVTIVEAPNLTGPDSPVSLFKEGKVDIAFVITPDAIALTSAEGGGVAGAHEVLSTADRARSIPDVYLVNPAYFAAHQEEVTKFVAGQIKGQENVVDLRKAYASKAGSVEYQRLLGQLIELMPGSLAGASPEDADGLVADCGFVGHPGNVDFFTNDANPTGWAYFAKRGAEVAGLLGYGANVPVLGGSPINWNDPIFAKILTKTQVAKGPRFDQAVVRQQIEAMEADGTFGANTRLSFTAMFPANSLEVDAKKYAPEFDRMLGLMPSYPNAPFVIRGHMDPTKMVAAIVKAGMAEGLIQQSGNSVDGYTYLMGGKPINIRTDRRLLGLATNPKYNGSYPKGENPRELDAAAREQSKQRADGTLAAFFAHAKAKGIVLDPTQFHTEGVGFAEPLIVKAQSPEEAAQNRRVEFSIVHVTSEAVTQSDFDL